MSMDYPRQELVDEIYAELTPEIEQVDEGWCFRIFNDYDEVVSEVCCFEHEYTAELACDEKRLLIATERAQDQEYGGESRSYGGASYD